MLSSERKNHTTSDEYLNSSSDAECDDSIKTPEDSSSETKGSSKLARCTKWIKTMSDNIGHSVITQFRRKPHLNCKTNLRNDSTISVDQRTSNMEVFYDAQTDVSLTSEHYNQEQEETMQGNE
jgi:hypothetical protein